MTTELVTIRDKVIQNIPEESFDSHEFIRHFAKEFETEYVEFLYLYKLSNPFRQVHLQIGKFLSVNQKTLNIVESGDVLSTNIFGIDSPNEKWNKINR